MGLLDAIVQSGRRDPEYHYRNGEELCRNGYYLDAIDALDTMLATNPLHAGSWFLKGYALYQSGHYEEAVQSLDRALEIFPGFHEALTYKGLISSASGRHTEALAFYDRALNFDSDSVKTWYVRGLTLGILERYDEAIRSYERALALEPGHIDALTGISIAMKRRDKVPAGNAAGKAMERAPHTVHASPASPRISRPPQTKPAQFIPLLAKPVKKPVIPAPVSDELFEKQPPAIAPFRHITTREKTPSGTDAIPSAAPIPAQYPTAAEPQTVFSGNACPGRSMYDEMILDLRGTLAANPLDAASWYSLGTFYMRVGKYHLASESYEHALDCNEENAAAWTALGDARKKSGIYDEALFAYERSLEIEPMNATTWISHARTYAVLGRYDDAIESCDRAIALDENNVDAWLYKGFVLRKIRRHDDAISAYNQVLAISPGHDHAARQKKSLIEGE